MLSSLSGAESGTYSYDNDGNITSDGTLSYTYDLNNRLIQASQGSAIKGQYAYDGLGRRVKKIAGNKTTYFLYDLTGKLIEEYDGSGAWQNNRIYLEGEPLARFNLTTPKTLSGLPYDESACLSWAPVTGASYYIVSWGDTSGYYPNCSTNITGTSYCVSNLSGLTWYFIVTAYSADGTQIGQSNEITAALLTPNPSLPHYSFNPVLGGQANCGICHVTPNTFLQGFGVRTSISLCLSCHNASSVGHDKNYGGKSKHPVFVNVTADASHRLPTLGYVNGTSSDKTYTHLLNGKQVVCMTCHNSTTKPNDPGRSWEYTTTTDNKTYTLQNCGWSYYSYVKPVVYRDTSLWAGPTYIKSRKSYLVSESEYDIDSVNGAIIFHQAQAAGTYVYVTLDNDYLRNTNEGNQLCLDCHVTATHKGNDCTACHGTHNSDNLYNVRQSIRTPQGALKGVVYSTATTMSGSAGICVVCHTATIYDNSTAIIQQPHYENNECANCHPHRQGFPTYTTVIRGVVGKFLAFIGFNNAYAEEPPPLENYSMGGGEGGMMSFEATATVQTESAQSQSQTITTDVIYYYHNDHLGTPMFMSDETDAKVWQREQMPFGEDTLLRGTVIENLRMPGQYWDIETGLSQNWNRDYSQKLGRYIEADPIGQAGGVNIFTYVTNAPINYIDPYGLAQCVYSISKHTLTCVSNNYTNNHEKYTLGPKGVFSGDEGHGPILLGNYNINPDNRPGHELYWRLEPDPPVSGLEYHLGLKRGGFMLHPGTISWGCITINKKNKAAMSQYLNIHSLLKLETGSNYLVVKP